MSNKNDNHSPSKYCVLAIILIVAILAACNGYFRPDEAGDWILATLILPVLWGFLTVYRRWALRLHGPGSDDEAVRRYSQAVGRFYILVMAAVGFLIMISLGFKLAGVLGLTRGLELAGRAKILGVGIVFVLLGNEMPKILTPQSLLPVGGALRVGTARRLLGWSWAIIGFALVLLSLFLPFGLVKQVARWMVMAALFAVPAAIIWINLKPGRKPKEGWPNE